MLLFVSLEAASCFFTVADQAGRKPAIALGWQHAQLGWLAGHF
jgi:hypothetical protein